MTFISRLRFGAPMLLGLALLGCSDQDTPIDRSASNSVASVPAQPVNQIIVKLKFDPLREAYAEMTSQMQSRLSSEAGVTLSNARLTGQGSYVLSLPSKMRAEEVQTLTAKLSSSADVLYAEPDLHMDATVLPNDALFSQQWDMVESEKVAGALGMPDAWEITTGDPNLVVAVIDTGVLPHKDLGNRLLAGYDFVSDPVVANDGDGRDTDARDAGDWLTLSEAQNKGLKAAVKSSWHGTHVAGTIAAAGSNGIGVAGVNWSSKILPVRVLGKGGGTLSDIGDAIMWAAGVPVIGVPNNPNPAKVINLSLGGTSLTCPNTYQTAINAAVNRGAVVVVAAGNSAASASNTTPANCENVITVGAVDRRGSYSAYSNYGSKLTVSAPGGNMYSSGLRSASDTGILSLMDGGATTPSYDNTYTSYHGTSMATPHVVGVVSLMLSVNPQLTPVQVKSILQTTARAFPKGTGYDCSIADCGAGIVDAAAAVKSAKAMPGAISSNQPQTGWWWNPAQRGRAFIIEKRNDRMMFTGMLYDDSGRSTWYLADSTMTSPTLFTAPLYEYRNGQLLNGAYRPAEYGKTVGDVQIQFTDATHATMTWPGGTLAIERFPIIDNGLSLTTPAFKPDNGFWWNVDERGRGFAIETQGNYLLMVGFMYDTSGNPVWYGSWGWMTSDKKYVGNWEQYGNGQTVAGNYQLPSYLGSPGQVQLDFTDTRNATLTLPTGKQLALSKLDVGNWANLSSGSDNLLKAQQMLGLWQFHSTIISTFTDYYLFDSTFESTSSPGQFYAYGLSKYGEKVIVGYFNSSKYFMLLAPHSTASFDDVFVYNLSGDVSLPGGCYYFKSHASSSFGTCYKMDALKLAEVTPSATGFVSWQDELATTRKAMLVAKAGESQKSQMAMRAMQAPVFNDALSAQLNVMQKLLDDPAQVH